MLNTPEFSDKTSKFKQSGVETFQRCFPQNPGKFCSLINTLCNAIDEADRQTHVMSVVGHQSKQCYTQKKSGRCR